MGNPPTNTADLTVASSFPMIKLRTWKIWRASSRVGVRIRVCGKESSCGLVSSWERAMERNAIVLPVPGIKGIFSFDGFERDWGFGKKRRF